MGQKNSKGTVSISNADNRIRLRWRYQSIRYSINLHSYSKVNLLAARKIALQIEMDIANDIFDTSLKDYQNESEIIPEVKKTVVAHFEEWTSDIKQMDCELHTNYNSLRNMLKKWGSIEQSNILKKLNAETFCAGTYNRRLHMLKEFVKWLVKKGIWASNPLEDINSKRVIREKQVKRKPFSEIEIKSILNAFKNDEFTPKSSSFKHSHYYPFIYFIFKTGVRNAEAIGLRASSVDPKTKRIYIKEVLARSLKGTSSLQRIRKETKNGKERVLPMNQDLLNILKPLLAGKKPDDLVFQSQRGLSIDDNNFQKRIFKKVLKDLGIPERVLYACRHTFGSRCIDSGITPIMTAFLMGNNPETALKNYTHQMNLPKDLPGI